MEVIYSILIILIASIIQGMTSFGASMIAMPLLLFFYDVSIVVPISISANLVMNTLIFRKLYKYQNIKSILPMFISALLFTIIGILFLRELNPNYIKLVIGLILIILSIVKMFGINLKIKRSPSTYIPVGMASGLLNGIAGLSGPPVIIFLSANEIEKNQFRATLTSYFLFLNIFTVISYIISGNYSMVAFYKFIVLVPALLIGIIIGVFVGNHVKEQLFKKIVLIFLAVMGIYMIYNVIG